MKHYIKLQSEDIVRGLKHYLRKRKAELDDSSFGSKTMELYDSEIDQALKE